MLWAAVMLLSVTNDSRWGDTQHGWWSLCAEWLLNQASGLVRGRRWEQKNIPCGPWVSWDAVVDCSSLLLVVYLQTGLAHSSLTWSHHQPLWGCAAMAVCVHVYRILRMQSQTQSGFCSAPAWLRRCWNSLDIYWSAQSTGTWGSFKQRWPLISSESRANKTEHLIQHDTVVLGVEWLCIPV